MLLKRGIRENSDVIEMSKNMVRLLTRNLQWGCSGGMGAEPSAQKFCIFLQKELNFRPILIKIDAFEMWQRN